MASKMKQEFVLNFAALLAEEGDTFFTSGDVEQDYDIIVNTIKQQGYWAGNAVRYIFDKNLEFEAIQPRMFGNS